MVYAAFVPLLAVVGGPSIGWLIPEDGDLAVLQP